MPSEVEAGVEYESVWTQVDISTQANKEQEGKELFMVTDNVDSRKSEHSL